MIEPLVVKVATSPEAFETTAEGRVHFRVGLTGSADERWRRVFERITKQEQYRRVSMELENRPAPSDPMGRRIRAIEFDGPSLDVTFDVIFKCEETSVERAFMDVVEVIATVNSRVAEGQERERRSAEERQKTEEEKRKELQRLTDKFKYLKPGS